MVTASAELLRLSFATSLLLVFNQKDYLEVTGLFIFYSFRPPRIRRYRQPFLILRLMSRR
jgi:hypothetical protein